MDILHEYKKRAGTSGISGQLYETKLISLILFRLLHNDNIEEFYLASNMDGIGAFDDICFKIKVKAIDRPLLVFIQAKHKDNDDKFITRDSKNNLIKWSNSIMKIKQQFSAGKNPDKIFSGKFDETECVFVLYTNAKYDVDPNNKYEGNFASILNKLVATNNNVGSRPLYTERDVQDIGERIVMEEMAVLAERFAIYLTKPNHSMNIMNDEYILRYHVILAKKIVAVSDVQFEKATPDFKWRFLTFRHDIFSTKDKYLGLFMKHLYDEIIKNHVKMRKKRDELEKTSRDASASETKTEELISTFLSKPSEIALSPLLGTRITFKHGKLEFISGRPQSDVDLLQNLDISNSTIDAAKVMAASNILLSLKLKIPINFGNADIAIRGNKKKIERRINYLTDIIVELCKKGVLTGPYKIVTIDETLDEGVLSSNGGLGGAIGNLIVYDDETKLLKFSDQTTPLHGNVKTLLLKVKSKLNNLHEYRFEIKALTMPKLSLDCNDTAKDFLNKLIIYAKQSNHYDVEEILKREMHDHHCKNSENISINIDSIFVNYHHDIQKWWMLPKTGQYLTNIINVYQQAINNIIKEPQITALQNMFQINKIRMNNYSFNNDTRNFLELDKDDRLKIAILTDTCTITTMKVIQCLKNKYNSKYAVLDLESIKNLPIECVTELNVELRNTEKMLIVVWDCLKINRTLHKRLDELAGATEDKEIIVISNKMFVEIAQEYFPCTTVVTDKKYSLSDLAIEAQLDVMRNTQVLFQDQEVSLDLFVDEVSVAFIKGAVFNNIVRDEIVKVGKSLSSGNYEEIKHLYVDRRVSQNPPRSFEYYEYNSEDEDDSNVYLIKTFHDINKNCVLLTAKPGMGKSTLLTHLSLKTKELDKNLWIVRINLSDHSKEFHQWQEHKTTIDTLETLKFICQWVIDKTDVSIRLEEIDDKVYLKSCTGDDWATFELNMFLHFYNEGKVIFAFDGFDEVCPHYKSNVIKFLDVVKNYPRENKMWVTSRPYTEILSDLERVFGRSYELDCIDTADEEIFLNKFWQTNLNFNTLVEFQLNNVISFMNYMPTVMQNNFCMPRRFVRILYQFHAYLHWHFPFVNANQFATYLNDLPSSGHWQLYSNTHSVTSYDRIKRPVDNMMGTPLLLYLLANYFVYLICNSKNSTKWELGINKQTIYAMFIESKLKNILYQDKNKMDIYNPDVITRYEKERADCIDKHKKIAAHVLYENLLKNHEFSFHVFYDMMPFSVKEFIAMLNTIKNGTEKTGLITHIISDNIPVFIHKTIEEYFAAKFICDDIFKSSKFQLSKKRLFYTALTSYNNQHSWINSMRAMDEELDYIINEINSTRTHLAIWYHVLFESEYEDVRSEQYIRLMSSSKEDYENNCYNKYKRTFFTKRLNELSANDRAMKICEIREDIIANMKPHLKKFFTNLSDDTQMSTDSQTSREPSLSEISAGSSQTTASKRSIIKLLNLLRFRK